VSDARNRLPKRVRPGDLDALRRKLWRAILRAETLLDHKDAEIQLRAVHATSQAASAYRAVYADSELEARLTALEARAEKGTHEPPP
jgi:precorrin isomerase